jgi:hypothetical protein
MNGWMLPPRGARQASSLFAASGALGFLIALLPSSAGHGRLSVLVANAFLVAAGCAVWAASASTFVRRTGAFFFPLFGFLTIAVTNL